MVCVCISVCVCVCLMASTRFPAVGYFDDHPVGGAYWDLKRLAEGRALFAWPSLRSSPFEGIITGLTFPDTKWRFYDNSPVMSALTHPTFYSLPMWSWMYFFSPTCTSLYLPCLAHMPCYLGQGGPHHSPSPPPCEILTCFRSLTSTLSLGSLSPPTSQKK